MTAVGADARQAFRAAKNSRRKDRPRLYYVDAHGAPHKQHFPMEDWLEEPLLHGIADILKSQNIEAYLVGGAVRDRLMGIASSSADLDLVVPANALETATMLADNLQAAYYPVDADRGVGRIVLPDKGHVDVASYRGSGLYEDLRLRDFTINAMAFQIAPAAPKLLDPLAGQDDLAAARIRATSEQAFTDDPLRVLRAIRFSRQFDFAIDAETRFWLIAHGSAITKVSAERLRDEMIKLLQVNEPGHAISDTHDVGLLAYIVPEVLSMQGIQQSPPHHLPVYEHTLRVMNNVSLLALSHERLAFLEPLYEDLQHYFNSKLAGNVSRLAMMPLAALLHDIGKPQTFQLGDDGRIRFWNHPQVGANISNDILSRWRLSDQARRFVVKIVRYHMRPLLLSFQKSVSKRAVHRFLVSTGDAAPAIALFSLLDHLGIYRSGTGQAEWDRLTDVVFQMCHAYFTPKPSPLLTGRDLIDDLDISPGPNIGVILRALQEAQAMGEITNRAEALAYAAHLSGAIGV